MKITKKKVRTLKYFIDLKNYQDLMDVNEVIFEAELFKTNNSVLIKKYTELKSSIISVIQLLKNENI